MAEIQRRRRWWLIAAGAAGLGTLALGGAAWWLQTAPGFQGVVLPAVQARLPVDAEAGRVGWGGAVHLEGLVYDDPDSGLRLEVDRLDARIAPRSLLADTLRIEAAVLAGVRATLDVSAPGAPEEPDAAPLELRLPVDIGRLALRDGAASVVDGAEERLRLRALRLDVADLVDGAEGRLRLRANAGVAPGSEAATDTTLDLGMTVTQGAPLAWSGEGVAHVRPRQTPVDTTFDLATEGTITDAQRLEGSTTWSARRAGEDLGRLEAEAAWTVGQRPTGRVLLADLTPGFLNPLLALRSDVQLDRGTVGGEATLTADGDATAFTLDLAGEQVVVRGARGPAPAVDAHAEARGRLETGAVRVEQATARVDEGGRRLVDVDLQAPAVISRQASAAGGGDAQLRIDVDRVPVAVLAPWASLAGTDLLDDMARGTLSADLTVDVPAGGQVLALGGQWSGSGLVTAEGLGPVDVVHPLDVRVEHLDAITIGRTTARIALDGRPAGTLQVGGTYRAETGATDLAWAVASPEALDVARRVDLGHDDLRGGRLALQGSVMGTDVLAVLAEGTLEDAALVREASVVAPRTAAIDLAASVHPDRVEIGDSTLHLSRATGEAGTVEIDGTWPLRDAVAGSLRIGLEKVEVADLLVWQGAFAPGAVPTAPLQGEVDLERAAGAAAWRVRGTETLGPFVANGEHGATLAITHDGALRGEVLDDLVIDVTTGEPEGTVHLEGQVRMADRVAVALSGAMEGVDTTPLAAAYFGPDEDGDQPPGVEELFDFEIPVDLDLTLQITDSLYYGFPIERGTLTLQGTGGDLKGELDAPGFGGGTAQGTFDLRVTRSPGIDWAFQATDTDVGTLVQALRGGGKQWVSGRGDVASEGHGQGRRRRLGRNVQGGLSFDVQDGQLGDLEALEFLAQRTGVDAFEQMGFQVARGAVLIDDGAIAIDRALVRGARTKLAAAGVYLDPTGSQDLRLSPRVAEAIWERIANRFGAPARDAGEGFRILPVDIVISGSWADPSYSVAPNERALDYVGDRVGSEIEEATGVDVGGMIDDLFGGGDDEPEPEPAPAPEPRGKPLAEPSGDKSADRPVRKPGGG